MDVCVCMRVLILVLFQMCPELLPGGRELRFVSDQRVSVVKYFSVVPQPSTVKLRGKGEPKTRSRGKKKKSIFLPVFGTNVAVISFCFSLLLFLLFFLFRQSLDGYRS